MPVKKIEVNFAIPVELTQAEMQLIDTIANDAARRTETDKVVHWAAGCGDKPNWSKTDCAIFGYEPTPDSPESGEPTFDSTIFCVETFARERYESEPFDPTKRKTPIADLLFSIRYPNPHSGTFQIREERVRQMQVEGWTKEHDDGHIFGQLAEAAVCYSHYAWHQLAYPDSPRLTSEMFTGDVGKLWPWDPEWWKPSPDPIRNLVKAGALIAAEIDRLRRKAEVDRAVQESNARQQAIDELKKQSTSDPEKLVRCQWCGNEMPRPKPEVQTAVCDDCMPF